MAEIIRIDVKKPLLEDRKKVAAYARVSAETDRLEHSLSAQISRYSILIQSNHEWMYAGVYSDNGISGTGTAKRQGFQEMIRDANAGKIDIILTKSISRFARNTVDLLNTVRHLKDIGVEVRFEKEGINTLLADGELMLTILASFAQEESRSISKNVKWGTVKRFEQGIPNGHFRIYGYRWKGDQLAIKPDEAKVVKLIYRNYLNGMSAQDTEKQLEQMGVKSINGKHSGKPSIYHILSNVTYTGNLLLQKVYQTSPVNGMIKINHGELAQYLIQNHHEAIIPMETFQKVQEEMAERRKLGVFSNKVIYTSCFTSKIKCGCCGKSYRRCTKTKHNGERYYIWSCRTKIEKGADNCHSKSIPENEMKRICAEVLHTDRFEEKVFIAKVNQITVISSEILEFHFTDGTVQQIHWKSEDRRQLMTVVTKIPATKNGRTYYVVGPSKKSIKKFREDIKKLTGKTTSKSFEQWTSLLNPILRGKYNYFLIASRACKAVKEVMAERGRPFHGLSYEGYVKLDGYVRQRLRVNFANRGKRHAKVWDAKLFHVKYGVAFFTKVIGLVCGEFMNWQTWTPEVSMEEFLSRRYQPKWKGTAKADKFFALVYAKK